MPASEALPSACSSSPAEATEPNSARSSSRGQRGMGLCRPMPEQTKLAVKCKMDHCRGGDGLFLRPPRNSPPLGMGGDPQKSGCSRGFPKKISALCAETHTGPGTPPLVCGYAVIKFELCGNYPEFMWQLCGVGCAAPNNAFFCQYAHLHKYYKYVVNIAKTTITGSKCPKHLAVREPQNRSYHCAWVHNTQQVCFGPASDLLIDMG